MTAQVLTQAFLNGSMITLMCVLSPRQILPKLCLLQELITAAVLAVGFQLQLIREQSSRKLAQLTFFCCETSRIPLRRVILGSQHSSCSLHTTTLSLVKENLVSAFDGISDSNILNSMAVETFCSVLKKELTCTTF